MAVPKQKTGRARTHSRRSANDVLALCPPRSVCPQCGEVKLPHRVCGNCGYYKVARLSRLSNLARYHMHGQYADSVLGRHSCFYDFFNAERSLLL